jgi:hypothetical protein
MVQRAGELFSMGPGSPLAARTGIDRATCCEVRSLTLTARKSHASLCAFSQAGCRLKGREVDLKCPRDTTICCIGAVAAEGIAIVTPRLNRAFLTKALTAPRPTRSPARAAGR